MKLLIENDFDEFTDVVSLLMNTTMQIERSRYLQAEPGERKKTTSGVSVKLSKPGIHWQYLYTDNIREGLNKHTSKNG